MQVTVTPWTKRDPQQRLAKRPWLFLVAFVRTKSIHNWTQMNMSSYNTLLIRSRKYVHKTTHTLSYIGMGFILNASSSRNFALASWINLSFVDGSISDGGECPTGVGIAGHWLNPSITEHKYNDLDWIETQDICHMCDLIDWNDHQSGKDKWVCRGGWWEGGGGQ